VDGEGPLHLGPAEGRSLEVRYSFPAGWQIGRRLCHLIVLHIQLYLSNNVRQEARTDFRHFPLVAQKRNERPRPTSGSAAMGLGRSFFLFGAAPRGVAVVAVERLGAVPAEIPARPVGLLGCLSATS